MANINRVILTGNLTRDPEVRETPGGTTVCKFGLAVNERYKDSKTGEWTERANFIDITVFGKQGENCGKYLAKGRAAAIDGRLRFEQWETDGGKRSKIVVIANAVQFLSDGREHGDSSESGGGGYRMESEGGGNSESGSYRMESAPATSSAADDDIPF